MPKQVAARLIAAVGLVIALGLFSMNWWYTGPIYFVAHLVFVGGAAALSRAVRGGEADGPSGALNAMALTLPLMGGRAQTGGTWEMVDAALRQAWFIWMPLVVLVLFFLWRRRRSLALLTAEQAIATCAVVTSAPMTVVAGRRAIGVEFMNVGLAVLIVYPVVVAAFATSWSWVFGRPSPAGNALRRTVPALALAGVVVATIATLATPRAGGSWAYGLELLSFGHMGWALALLAVALHFARDPVLVPPEQAKLDEGPHRRA